MRGPANSAERTDGADADTGRRIYNTILNPGALVRAERRFEKEMQSLKRRIAWYASRVAIDNAIFEVNGMPIPAVRVGVDPVVAAQQYLGRDVGRQSGEADESDAGRARTTCA
jgi:hypothetical protein